MVQTANRGQEVIYDTQHDHKSKLPVVLFSCPNLSLLLGGADLDNGHLS